MFTLLDSCVSSLRRGRTNLLCIVPILTDAPQRESAILYDTILYYTILYYAITELQRMKQDFPLAPLLISFGWQTITCLTNGTCMIRPHLFYACFVLSRSTILRHIVNSPLLKKACVRQAASDKWFPLNK